jgi:hypothetical protein
MDKPVQAEGAHLAPTDFAAKRRRKSFAAYFRMRGTDALVPGFNGTVLADLFLAAGYVDGRHVNDQCLAEPREKFVWRCTEIIKIPAAVAERLYDENPRVLPVAPPAADSSGSVSVKKAKRQPRNLWHVVLVPQPAQPSTIQLATDVWLKRRAMPSDWTEIATRCILGKQLHSLKTQRDGMRYNSDAFYDEEATGIITEQCNDMLGLTCCSIALCTALLTTTKAKQQDWHIDDEDKTYCSAIAPFGANGRTLVFRSSVAGADPLTFRVDVGDLVLFRVYLCHAGGASQTPCVCRPGNVVCASNKDVMTLSDKCCEYALHGFVATTAAINATIGQKTIDCALNDLRL